MPNLWKNSGIFNGLWHFRSFLGTTSQYFQANIYCISYSMSVSLNQFIQIYTCIFVSPAVREETYCFRPGVCLSVRLSQNETRVILKTSESIWLKIGILYHRQIVYRLLSFRDLRVNSKVTVRAYPIFYVNTVSKDRMEG